METAPLKSFATWARIALIREVSARISVVLASEELRQEQPNAVAALNKAVNAAGGSDKGRDTVADKVAYTWFNRIIALRFMDAKAYTGIGVVSPERGREGGQPEILAEAKRGNIDGAVVTNKRTIETVTSLLNGTRRSNDPQGEAYALLLAEYCRHWNRSMPFMFEREGDYTELLIPGNLLADDSVLARAARVLTEDVCQDVEVIGWLYQFYISARKDEVFAGFKKNKKATAKEIPAATQLFTPHWIVKYLVENSLGRLWLLNNPGSRLAEQMEYYIAPLEPETDFLKIRGPEELRVLDPACGSGHMLTYAFDLLYLMYEESGYARSDIPGLILQHNLFGAEIDPRAGALAAFALVMKARGVQRSFLSPGKGTEPNVCVLEPVRFSLDELETLVSRGGDKHAEKAFWQAFEDADTFGSLIRPNQGLIEPMRKHLESMDGAETLFGGDVLNRARTVVRQSEYLSNRYQVLVANPPYMGSGNMGAKLAEFAKREYPTSKFDLFAMFMERSPALLDKSGYAGLVTMESWMYLTSFRALRASILLNKSFCSVTHMPYSGKGGTPMGINFGTVAFILRNYLDPDAMADYQCIRYFETDDLGVPLSFPVANDRRAVRKTADFQVIPNQPIAYWAGPATLKSFRLASTSIASMANSEGKNVTTDNARFARFHWEVQRRYIGSFDKKWLPCAFGGDYRKWYGNVLNVIDWSTESREFYRTAPAGRIIRPEFWGLPGVTWSKISSGKPSFRLLPKEYMYQEVALLQTDERHTSLVLGILNSSVGSHYLSLLSPTLNTQNEDVISIPILNPELLSLSVPHVVQELVAISRADWDQRELSMDFKIQPLVAAANGSTCLKDASNLLAEEREHYVQRMLTLETQLNATLVDAYGLDDEVSTAVARAEISLMANVSALGGDTALLGSQSRGMIADLMSYAVGCMFGRYSLDTPGLVLADQGNSLAEYLVKVPSPSFMPDQDGVLPVLSDAWFEDDIAEQFRAFLKVAFGEDRFEENLRFVEETLGKEIRKYFVQDFYKDHVQRYKKRPIYWLFSSPKGSFNALIYMHRYTPSTASTVLNEYLREFKAKLDASRQHHERLAAGTGAPREQAAAQKEVDRLRKILLELDEYEHDVLYPLASQQVQIDLDDGVKANYPKLGAALKKIPGLEAGDE